MQLNWTRNREASVWVPFSSRIRGDLEKEVYEAKCPDTGRLYRAEVSSLHQFSHHSVFLYEDGEAFHSEAVDDGRESVDTVMDYAKDKCERYWQWTKEMTSKPMDRRIT